MARVVHFDIAAADVQRAARFYERVFGWTITKANGPLDYWLMRTGDAQQPGIDGGLAQRAADWQGITMFIDVTSVDEVTHAVQEAGGVIVEPRTVIPGVGFVVCCRDTEGNVFAMIEQSETAGF